MTNRKLIVFGTLSLITALVIGSVFGALLILTLPSWRSFLPFKVPKAFQEVPGKVEEIVKSEKRVVTGEESATINVVETASPAVVSVVTKEVGFDPETGIVEEEKGIGTGFIVESEGLVLTNWHVVSDERTEYTIVAKDKKSYPVSKIFRDQGNDTAIVKINASGLPTLKLGDSSNLKVGQTVVAIGNALGKFDNSVTTGVVSQIGRKVTANRDLFGLQKETLENVIQTDAALNPGNSGGPLLNLSAEVIGINVATTQGAQNIGFAIPINIAKGILDGFRQQGRIVKPYLGVSYQLIEGSRRVPSGALVRLVVPSSPAEKAGIQAKDIIIKLNESKINVDSPLSSVITKQKVGDTIEVTVWRDGGEIKLRATLGESPPEK